MKNKALLTKLADYLDELDVTAYDIGKVEKGPLYHATRITEFKAKGFKWRNGVAHYEGETDIVAAMALFDIDEDEAKHLFDMHEFDEYGERERSPFTGTSFRGGMTDSQVVLRGEEKAFKYPGETPAWTANRIRAFIKNYDAIRAVKTNNPRAA